MNKENAIVLKNERSGHVNKLVNELGSWSFFKVLYRNDMLKVIGMNLLLLVFWAPLVYLVYRYSMNVASIGMSLPGSGAIGFGYAPWINLSAELARQSGLKLSELLLWLLPAGALIGVSFAGGLAIIRDSFWTGRIKVFKPFLRGILENGLQSFVVFVVLIGCVNGIYHASAAMLTLPAWASVIIQIVMWLVFAFVTIYLFVFLSVNSAYKQSLGVDIKTSWHILTRYIVSTLIKFIIAFIPAVLLVVTIGGTLFAIMIAVFAVFGLFYTVFVWQSHMMRIFYIYNPVEKIKTVKRKAQHAHKQTT